MRYCKLRAEEGNKIVPIIKEKFESATGVKKPYYQGEKKQAYAICTYCENPVVIVGFYSKHGKYTPHQRHTKAVLQNMPKYSQSAYDLCIYAKPQKYKKEDRKPLSADRQAKVRIIYPRK
ncbi:MAG: hypothetical protein FWG65_13265 [Turicibacter sp.]|nr:hypothetical protein [Turicibacter sp.]